jgi:hypothetical protein
LRPIHRPDVKLRIRIEAGNSLARQPNARAPSNTVEPSQAAWVRGPMIGTLPSCHSPSKKVQVCEKLTDFMVWAIIAIRA